MQGGRKNEFIFILGGARSGKSDLALQLCRSFTPRAFVATAEPLDQEMESRIRTHQRHRRGKWDTVEIPVELSAWFRTQGRNYEGVVVDCLTLWLNNVLGEKTLRKKIPSLLKDWLQSVREVPGRVIVVSNEVGLGIVPGEPLARNFRDVAGRMNQQVASVADEVYFVVSGIPLRLK
ncbi:MAG: bifunctional adenosylcobinamide kinase/adenosylcobinamide-phosphate guanylyltransferase [Nitrospirales bacterium]|nr:bifunctional adenosylcobinamide kinase/adenosylcobinamide-phosphate guanylyltransferase [Nitrospirales bacterium]